MSKAPVLEDGFEFPGQSFSVAKADQVRKLTCSGIDPAIYGEAVDVAMLGLPTLRVLMACGIPILGGVHLSQRFRQKHAFLLEEEITISGRILEIAPHPRGCILKCAFEYARQDGTVCLKLYVPVFRQSAKTSNGIPRRVRTRWIWRDIAPNARPGESRRL